jgi:hypothetical protein
MNKSIKLITKLLFIIALASCTYHPRQVDINLGSTIDIKNNPNSPFYLGLKTQKGYKLPKILVTDKRQCKRTLGIKQFGKNTVKISNDQDLAKTIKKAVKNILIEKQLNYDHKKIITIELLTLNHNATRKFFIGESNTNIEINAIIQDKNKKGRRTATRSKTLKFDDKYFISSTKASDEQKINKIIRDAIDELFADKKLLDLITNK